MEGLIFGVHRERTKRDDLLRLAVVEDSEVVLVQAGDWLSGGIRDEHVEDDVVGGFAGVLALFLGSGNEANGGVGRGLRGLFWRGRSGIGLLGERGKSEADEERA